MGFSAPRFEAGEPIMEPAIMLVGHGSRDREGTEEFERLVELYRRAEPERIVEYGYLEFAAPAIGDGVAACVERGAKAITVLPGMLMAAGHVKNDIPSEIHAARLRYPDVDFRYGRHLHLHAKIIELCQLRLEEAERAAPPHDRADTLLLVVNRGSSDPEANGDVQKLARILSERMGYGSAAACHSAVAVPSVPDGLKRCRHMGFRRILVFPYFLFTGVLEKRVRANVSAFAQENRDIEVLYAGYLNAHPLLCEVFRERAEEVDTRPS
jgi:sirohydrochlorin ferrochelatase